MRWFDPRKVAHFEKENWKAYYEKRWLTLLRVSVGMVKEAYSLSWWQALYATYLVVRAEVAFAPFPDNDIPRAERYMQRFYAYIKRIHRAAFDVEEAAHLEVQWWIVHRELFAQAENQPLIDAVAALYSATYGIAPGQVQEAAAQRAQAMTYSDQWVNAGCQADSQLLAQVQDTLIQSYTALHAALESSQGPAA